MGIKEKLYSKVIFRNILATFGLRSSYSYSVDNKTFVPYFQYKIGKYQHDFYLYFEKEPFKGRYVNEFFNKMREYNGYDLVLYMEFHYEAYADKRDFLRFLWFEISERLKLNLTKVQKLKLQSAQDWVAEKQAEVQQLQEQQLRKEVETDVRSLLQNQANNSPSETENQIKALSERMAARFDQLASNTENRFNAIADSFVTGHIQLHNDSLEKNLIQLFILLRNTKTGKAEQLFRKFSLTDMAAMLRLHFSAFKDKQLNTVQKKINEYASDLLETNNQKVKPLSDALEDFFAS